VTLRLLADENLDGDIIRGLFRRQPTLDIVRVQNVGLTGAPDERVLEWAADNGRVLLTHEVNTIPRYAYDRVRAGLAMVGVIEASPSLPVSVVLDDVLLLAAELDPQDLDGQVLYLPL
jgi:hypothetical protein